MAHVTVYGDDTNKPKFRHLSESAFQLASKTKSIWIDDINRPCMTEASYTVYHEISQYEEEIRRLTRRLGKAKAALAVKNCQPLDYKDNSTYEDHIAALTDAWTEERLERRMRR